MKLKFKNMFLYFTVAIVNLVSFSTGIALSWTSPALPILSDNTKLEDNPLGRPITVLEESWIAGITPLGSILGCLVTGLAANKLGRKKFITIVALAFILSLMIMAFANTIVMILIGRVIAGFASGCTFNILPVYFAEIAENHNRGLLGCSFSIFIALGILFTYGVGPVLSLQNFNLVCITPLVVFLPGFLLLCAESPHYLAMINNQKSLKVTLLKLRNNSLQEIEKEILDITKMIQEQTQNKIELRNLLSVKTLRKGLLISVVLVLIQQFSGFAILVFYMQAIFEASGTTLTPEISVIVVAIVQVFATSISSILIDRLGRRFLLLFSASGCCLSLVTLGIYFFFSDTAHIVNAIFWLPIVSLMVFMLCFNVGLGPATWAVMAEIFSPNVKAVATTVTTVVCFFSAFVTTFFFPYLNLLLGEAQSFWIFAVICACGIVFIFLMVPETKGKSLLEIQTLFE